MSVRSFLSPILSVLLVLSAGSMLAQGGPPPSKRPPAEFDDFETPLQKALKQAYRENATGKKDKMPDNDPEGRKDKCAAAITAGNDNQIAQFCDDVGTLTSETVGGGAKEFKHPDGKSAGKRLVTRTNIHYKSPKQKGRSDDPPEEKWPTEKLKGFERVRQHLPGPALDSSAGGVSRSFGSSFLPAADANDDHDCIDTLTGEHYAQDSCFDAAGKMIGTLTVDPAVAGACRHLNGSVYFGDATDGVEDDCWDKDNVLKTTLVELIDEDGAEELDNDGDGQVNEDGLPLGVNDDNDCIDSAGTIHRGSDCLGKGPLGEALQPLIDEDGVDLVDNDGDGRTNEDGVAARAESDCARFYRGLGMEPTADESEQDKPCDVGRALVKFVNDKAVSEGKKKLFKAKDDGTYDPDATDGVEPGKEERNISITESFGVKCRRGSSFVAGVCIPDDELENADPETLATLRVIGESESLVATAESDDPVIAKVAMMGFTFAPPVIEWGYKIDESVCVLGICVEVFYARIGYEFDLALGLRLPVEVELPDAPDSVLAGSEHTIDTQVEPLNFTTSQFEDFCNQHNLADDWFIGGGGGASPCRRFGFTNFLDAAVPDSLLPPDKKDGDEFVARYSVFAGIQVRVLMIPIINWAIDSSLDIPAACTMKHIIDILKSPGDIPMTDIVQFVQALMGFGGGTQEGIISVLDFIKDKGCACGTFETPFGWKDDGAIRPFPFSGKYEIRADCAEAAVRGEVITIGGQPRPICTNMILGVSGASLGVGLGLEARAGSNLIRSKWNTAEDATKYGTIDWTHAANEAAAKVALTFKADNYDDADFHDTAKISLKDFVYYLNLIQLTLNANLQFGGILSPIPDIGSFPIYRLNISVGDWGIPIPQHPATEPVWLGILVENYGLETTVKPETSDPALLVDADTLRVVPGEYGSFLAGVRNIGSFTGGFDNFRIALSNRPGQEPGKYTFVIDPNNDHDCRLAAGSPCTLRGIRWDGVADDCYLDSGEPRADRIECIDEDSPSTVQGLSRAERDDDGDGWPDEDPPDVWATSPTNETFATQSILDLSPYTSSTSPTDPPLAGQSLRVAVNPFRHPLTSPGVYPIKVTADSTEAKAKSLAAVDPSGNSRKDAIDVSFINIESFFEPQVVVLPNKDGGKPGVLKSYVVEGTNAGNAPDSMSVTPAFIDFNQAHCTLTTLGRLAPGSDPNCAYRAVPTAIPAAWTTVSTLTPYFPETQPGQLAPLESSTDSITVTPPRDWAGMDDTVYRIRVTTVSQVDTDEPPATRYFVGEHKVEATKESMTRYIGLEIAELIATLEKAAAEGVTGGGIKPIAVHPIQASNLRALDAILAGDLKRASGVHSTSIHLVEAFVRALDGGGKNLPPALFADLHARAAAMLADLAKAEACMVASAP